MGVGHAEGHLQDVDGPCEGYRANSNPSFHSFFRDYLHIRNCVPPGDPKIFGFVCQNPPTILIILAIRADSVDAKANKTKAILGRVGRHDLR